MVSTTFASYLSVQCREEKTRSASDGVSYMEAKSKADAAFVQLSQTLGSQFQQSFAQAQRLLAQV